MDTLGCFHILTIMNSTTVNMEVQISQHTDFISFKYIHPSGIASNTKDQQREVLTFKKDKQKF